MRITVSPGGHLLDEARAEAAAAIDASAERLRRRFITPGAGQALTYGEKVGEAAAFLADASIAPELVPHLHAEVGITGATLQEVAAAIIERRDLWRKVSAAIERVRLGRKSQVMSAQTPDEARALAHVDWDQEIGVGR